ncbi:hypothetical protein RhiLY_10166 [Ceratobasidium sp. AG-Ba]|nr:hypothetical protein RhiLY_10166 [Ceratobasidium sp. AG-Ba]
MGEVGFEELNSTGEEVERHIKARPSNTLPSTHSLVYLYLIESRMLDCTSSTASPRHHPYRSPSPRSNSSAGDHATQLSYPLTVPQDAPTPDLNSGQLDDEGVRIIVPIRMSNAKNNNVRSLWDDLTEARRQSNARRCFELANKMHVVVAESNKFCAELKQKYTWITCDMPDLFKLNDGYLTFHNCSIDHFEDVQRIATELADFRDHLSRKYDWLDVTFDQLKDLSGEEITAKTLDLLAAGDNIPSESSHCFKDRQKFRRILEHIARSGTLSDVGELADTEGNNIDDHDSEYRYGHIRIKFFILYLRLLSEDSAARQDFIEEVNQQRRRLRDSQSYIYRRIENFNTKPSNLPQLKWEHDLHTMCEAPIDCMVWACHAEFQGCMFASMSSPDQSMAYLHPNWTMVKNRWGYVPIEARLDCPNKWSIGDVVYKPIPAFGVPGTLGQQLRFELKTPFSYWVCTYDEDMPVKHQWKEIQIGGRHPLMCRFTLLHVSKQTPVWVYRDELSCDCLQEIAGALAKGGVCLSCEEGNSPSAETPLSDE